jgi:hypothetical protein
MLQYDFLHDLSLTFTLYNKRPQKTSITFYLRNLTGVTLEEQTAEAEIIMGEVAEELYHITRVGIDKCVLKSGKQKLEEQTYPIYTPPDSLYYFHHGAVYSFSGRNNYQWMVNDQWYTSWNEQIKKGAVQDRRIISKRKAFSFRLPCVASPLHNRDSAFFVWDKNALVYWNRQDPLFQRFIGRFFENGYLCIGEKRYFAQNNSYRIKGTYWSPPKSLLPGKDRERFPRKTVLATQPTDNTNYVYLIRMGRTQFYKIGKSNDPRGRLTSLQTGSPQKLTLIHTFRADNASAAEEALHRVFHQQRNAGEWFKLSPAHKDKLVTILEYRNGLFNIGNQTCTADELIDFGQP